MELFIVLLFIWVVIIQSQLNKLNDKIDTFTAKEIKQDIAQEIKIQEVQPEKTFSENNDIENSQPEKQEENIHKSNFENIFLGNIFNKIGAVAIIIGFIIFIKLISSYIVFTPVMKIATGYIASILMAVLGSRIRNEKVKGFKETLWGTSVSVTFISTYCASALFHIFTPQIAIIIATLTLVGVYFVADKQKTLSMIIIALIAGYLNPVFIHKNVSTDFLIGYYIFINLLSVIYVYRNPNRDIINFINLILTSFSLLIIMWWVIGLGGNNIIYPLILWFIYLGYDILRKEKSVSDKDKNNILNWLNFGILALFTVWIFTGQERAYAGYLLLSAGLIYAGLVFRYIKKESVNYKPYLYSALVTVLLSTLLLADGVYRIGLWSLESIILIAVAHKYKLSYLGNWALGFLLAAITGTLCTNNVIYFSDIQKYKPVLNIRTLSFAFPVTSAYIAYRLLSKNEDESLKSLCKIFQFSWISLIYLYITFELNSLIYKYNNQMFDKDFTFGMLLSIIGFKYSLQMKRIYNLSASKLFNVAAYIIGGSSLLYILIAGFEYEPIKYFYPIINVRFIAYLMAVITSICFAKWTKVEFFKYLAVVLGFILVHIETNDFINSLSVNNIDYLLTIMWLIYIGLIILFGIFKSQKSLKNTGIWLSILAILRIFVYDLENTDMIYKLIAFLTLGVILMIVSYFYNKYNKEG